MERPNNPFKDGTISWTLMEMSLQSEFDGLPGTSDMTVAEIADFFGISESSARGAISHISQRSGYAIKFIRRYKGKWEA